MAIIVFGFDSHNTAGCIRCLGEAGYRPTIVLVSNKKRTAVSHSKYIDQCRQVRDIESGIELIKTLKIDGRKQYLFATSDKASEALDKAYNELCDYFIFPNAGKQGELTRLMDKSIMCNIASQCGISIPWSLTYRVDEPIPDDIKFPCLIKPIKSINGSKQDIRIFQTKEELENYFSEPRVTKEYIIQEFIDKEYELVLIGCRTVSKRTFLPAHLRKTRSVGAGDETSCGYIRRGLPSNINIDSYIHYLDQLNYIGPFGIELGIKDGVPYFFEINFRNDGTTRSFTRIGINIPDMWITNNESIDISKPSEALYIDEIGDFLNVIRGDISIRQWWKDFRKASVYKYYDSHDKGPFKVFFPRLMRVNFATLYRRLTGNL